MKRRQVLESLGAALLGGPLAVRAMAADRGPRRKILFFSRSVLFEHPFSMMEEWFSLVQFAKDLHVVLVQDCAGMNKSNPADRRYYDRPPYPATWARMYGKGRVFYTSMGHREDVWTIKPFRQVLQGGLRWALGDAAADISPNILEVTPRAEETRK